MCTFFTLGLQSNLWGGERKALVFSCNLCTLATKSEPVVYSRKIHLLWLFWNPWPSDYRADHLSIAWARECIWDHMGSSIGVSWDAGHEPYLEEEAARVSWGVSWEFIVKHYPDADSTCSLVLPIQIQLALWRVHPQLFKLWSKATQNRILRVPFQQTSWNSPTPTLLHLVLCPNDKHAAT